MSADPSGDLLFDSSSGPATAATIVGVDLSGGVETTVSGTWVGGVFHIDKVTRSPQYAFGDVVSAAGVFEDYRYMVLGQRGDRVDLLVLNSNDVTEGYVMRDIVVDDGWRRHG